MKRKDFLQLVLANAAGFALGGGVLSSCNYLPILPPIKDGNKHNTNKYQKAGEELLDLLIDKYYKPERGLYAREIDSQSFEQSEQVSFLWATARMIRALLWGTMVNEAKYKDILKSLVASIDWYKSGQLGYGVTRNAVRFFDDNAFTGNTLMGVYLNQIRSQDVMDKIMRALDFNLKYRDNHWGLPQKKKGLGEGRFHVGSVNGVANAFARLYPITKNPDHLYIAKTYYDKLNDYDLKLKNPETNLLKGGSIYENGEWHEKNVGYRPGATTGVITLGAKLYEITGKKSYLNTIKIMSHSVLKKWYKPNSGLDVVPFWGGPGTIDMLCSLQGVEAGNRWYKAAKDIMDFLIEYGKDKGGFYATGVKENGTSRSKWNSVRVNEAPPKKVPLNGQACAANAILRFAYLDLNK